MMELHGKVTTKEKSLNYEEIAASEKFKDLLAAKKKFTVVTTLFFMSFALMLPVLAFYSNILTKPAIGALSWGWVYAFAQFVMTGGVCHLYVKKAAVFDEMAEQVLSQQTEVR